MSQRGLEALLRPKSIAVIGASMKPDRAGYLMMRNLLAGGFNGPVMPVTPAEIMLSKVWSMGAVVLVATGCGAVMVFVFACLTSIDF